jgi:2-keto-4-pentenoate hydratase/2-oxohepta-3-ene-1,7-dioic acid hydratase in catechol pathway
MRLLNLAGRLALDVDGARAIDVEKASEGRFGPDPQSAYADWTSFRDWAAALDGEDETVPVDVAELGPPSPSPRQVFAVGLNYREHAQEAGLALPDIPMIFTKFPSSITGPGGSIALPKGSVDFEVELAVVMGRQAHHVSAADAWDHVAGLTVGQDLSERELQLAGSAPQQFNLGKSFPGFSPIGPVLVTPDALPDPDDVEISCTLNGVEVQRTRTSDMIFPVPAIIEFVSAVATLYPGDLIFTGTPSGTGWSREPKLLVGDGDELVTVAEGIGEMRHTFRAEGLR